MDKVPHTNNTHSIQYGIANGRTVMVNPGETVMVDAPPSKKTVEAPPPRPPAAPGAASALQELQQKPVAEIKEMLPALSEAELKQLLTLETASPTPRKTLVAEIETSILALKTSP